MKEFAIKADKFFKKLAIAFVAIPAIFIMIYSVVTAFNL